MRNLQATVAQTVDRLDMHATAPALLLDLQGRLGDLAREALRITENGRRPFRPSPAWGGALAEVAFAVLSLADQTGVDVEEAVAQCVARLSRSPMAGPPAHGQYPPPGMDPRGPGPGPAPHPGQHGQPGRPGQRAPRNPPPDEWPLSY